MSDRDSTGNPDRAAYYLTPDGQGETVLTGPEHAEIEHHHRKAPVIASAAVLGASPPSDQGPAGYGGGTGVSRAN